MRRTLRIACGVALVALVLTGCRYGSTYTVNPDNTVSGRIYIAGYQDPADPPGDPTIIEEQANSIAAVFSTSTVTPHNEGDWVGFYVYIDHEPLASFADPPEATWDVQILKSGNEYRVFGYTATEETAERTSANTNSGYLELDIHFPGNLIESTGATDTTVTPGWAHFNLLTMPLNQTPYAKGFGPPPPEPDPVVTVVITPHPDPVVTPAASPSASPNASPSAAPAVNGDGDSIPIWVWAVGGGLVVALAGMIGFMAANRKPAIQPPTETKSKAKPVVEEPEAEEAEDVADEDEAEEEKPPPKKKK
ncbi:MAG: hypothetical protein JW722_01655 [Demequinaceae bacterium]|nr:hypothetical protein [Demequinaceae bacterium]